MMIYVHSIYHMASPRPKRRRNEVNRKSRSGAISAVPPPSSTSTAQRLGRHTVKGAAWEAQWGWWIPGWEGGWEP